MKHPEEGRFLSDLRALRAQAGLDHGALAARAHYPRDVITSAESGPALPDLPVLAAYVRGCGGNGDEVVAWEDRWRSVTGATAHPLRSARVAGISGGASAAASAWATSAHTRISGAPGSAPPDGSDPAVIMAALHRFGERMSQPARNATEAADTPAAAPRSEGARPAGGPAAVRPPVAESAAGPPAAARDGHGPAGHEYSGRPQSVPRENPGRNGGQRRRTSGRMLMIAVIAAVLLCLLIMLAL